MLYKNKPHVFKSKFTAVGCFLEYDSKILILLRCKNKNEGCTWCIPGGKVEKNEDIITSMKRELFEESGIKITKEKLLHFGKFYVKYPSYDFVYHIFNLVLNKKPKIKISLEEHSKFKWILPKNIVSINYIRDLDNCLNLFYDI